MNSLFDKITDWLKEMLVGGIMDNLSGMFDSVNDQVGEIAGNVGASPASFSPEVFSGELFAGGVQPDPQHFRISDHSDCRTDPDIHSLL